MGAAGAVRCVQGLAEQAIRLILSASVATFVVTWAEQSGLLALGHSGSPPPSTDALLTSVAGLPAWGVTWMVKLCELPAAGATSSSAVLSQVS